MEENNNTNGSTRDNRASEREGMPLIRLFGRAATLMHRYQRYRLHSHMHDPNRGQGRVLSLLRIKPDISQKDLAYLLDMRSQSLGELLVKLERAGLIERTVSEDDRRVMNISLTDAGRAAAEQADSNQAESGRFFDCLTAEEQTQLAGLFKKIIAAMENEMDEEYEALFEEARQHGREMHRHGERMRDEMREQARDMHDRLHEHGRAFRHQMRDLRHDMYRDGGFWGEGWDGWDPADRGPWDGEEGRGNGPRD